MTAAPRVAVVVTQLGFGGAERQTFELLRALVDGPLRPALVICLSEDLEPFGPGLRGLGYELVVLPRSRSFDVGRLLRLRRLLRRHRIDVVHAVHLLASAYVHWATRGLRIGVVPSVRGTIVRPGALKGFSFRAMFRAAPHTLVNSRRGARFIVENLGAPADRVVVVPNGIRFGALRAAVAPPAARRSLGLPANVPLVLYVGKNSAVKNVPRCVRVVGQVLQARPDAHAVFAGSGLAETARATLAPGLPVDRTHFVGPRTDLAAWQADADVLLLTSDSEGMPNVVLEALALGVPVVSSDVGDVAEIVGSAGVVVPPADEPAYVAGLLAVLAARAEWASRVREAWPRLEADYGLERMVERTTDMWRSALSAARA